MHGLEGIWGVFQPGPLNAGGKIHELLVGKFFLIQKAADSEGPGLWQVVGSGWGAEVTEVRKLRGPGPVWL